MSRADELRAEADRIEAEALKAERLKTADTIPTCPECGNQSFNVGAWTIVTQTIDFSADKDGMWWDDHEGGEYGNTNADAECAQCGRDCQDVLRRFGWRFFGDPVERLEP